MKTVLLLSLSAFSLLACQPKNEATPAQGEAANVVEPSYIGAVEMTASGIIDPEAKIEDLGGAFGWSEGPVWIAEESRVLFTDVPGNIMWSYKEGEGLTEFLSPSGLPDPKPDYISSQGANGLIRLNTEEILLLDHGHRGLYAMNLSTRKTRLIVDKYNEKAFNSPNDAVLHKTGIIFFTDPPYGLAGQDQSNVKEIPFNGVYAYSPSGEMTLIDDSLTRPNGIILSPDQRTLYVSNSDPEITIWKAYPVAEDGAVGDGEIFFDATADFAKGERGNADGMAVDTEGRIYATGPGGVIVFSPQGERLGLIRTGKLVANVTFGGEDGSVLYMTSHDILARVPMLVTGQGF